MQSLAPLAAFIGAYALLHWFLRGGHPWLPLDRPNSRSLHAGEIPRVGGIGILFGLGLSLGLALEVFPLWLALTLVLAIISFLDDRRSLPVSLRLAVHIAAAMLFAAWMTPESEVLMWLVLVIVTVWMVNLYNFMDGSDGLAGGMAVFGFGYYGLAAWHGGNMAFALACWSISAAALAFLRFNFHPAQIFMGDAGSIPLGFLAAALGIEGWLQGLWSPLFPILVFSPFIVDATLTIVRRALAGERIWQAHRAHYYQRLVRMGWGHRKTALAEYGLMVAMGLLGLLAEWGKQSLLSLGLATFLYGTAIIWIDRCWRSHEVAMT